MNLRRPRLAFATVGGRDKGRLADDLEHQSGRRIIGFEGGRTFSNRPVELHETASKRPCPLVKLLARCNQVCDLLRWLSVSYHDVDGQTLNVLYPPLDEIDSDQDQTGT
jgi:hypothetical protein